MSDTEPRTVVSYASYAEQYATARAALLEAVARGENVQLYSPIAGVGKTHLLRELEEHLAENGYKVVKEYNQSKAKDVCRGGKIDGKFVVATNVLNEFLYMTQPTLIELRLRFNA